jgi:hypothetical protein
MSVKDALGLAAASAVATGCALAGMTLLGLTKAHAWPFEDVRDEKFMHSAEAAGFDGMVAQMVTTAHEVCEDLADGWPMVAVEQVAEHQLRVDNPRLFVSLATET